MKILSAIAEVFVTAAILFFAATNLMQAYHYHDMSYAITAFL